METWSWLDIYRFLDDAVMDVVTRGESQLQKAVEIGAAPIPDESLFSGGKPIATVATPNAPDGLLDDVCASFARDLTWPSNLDLRQVYLVFLRLVAARDLAEFVCHSQDQEAAIGKANQFDRQKMLHWVLIDYWHHAGLWRWHYEEPSEDGGQDS